MSKSLIAAAWAAGLLAATPAAAASIVNGSFEAGAPIPAGGFTTESAGSGDITGWTVGGVSVDYIGTYWQAADGQRSIDLSGSIFDPQTNTASGAVSQVLTTVTGKTYKVSFALAGNPDGPGGDSLKVLVTTASGAFPQVDTFLAGAGFNSHAAMGWVTKNFTFKATSGSTLLAFASDNDSFYGPALDNVSISAIPEPATWAMMIAGFGVAGATIRAARRRHALLVG